MTWHKYPEEKPTIEKSYCVIRKYRGNCQTGIEPFKDGEIWVEMDYWNNDPESSWYGWGVGRDNPYWETLYWIDLVEAQIALPDDLPGPVTRISTKWFYGSDEL